MSCRFVRFVVVMRRMSFIEVRSMSRFCCVLLSKVVCSFLMKKVLLVLFLG